MTSRTWSEAQACAPSGAPAEERPDEATRESSPAPLRGDDDILERDDAALRDGDAPGHGLTVLAQRREHDRGADQRDDPGEHVRPCLVPAIGGGVGHDPGGRWRGVEHHGGVRRAETSRVERGDHAERRLVLRPAPSVQVRVDALGDERGDADAGRDPGRVEHPLHMGEEGGVEHGAVAERGERVRALRIAVREPERPIAEDQRVEGRPGVEQSLLEVPRRRAHAPLRAARGTGRQSGGAKSKPAN